MRVKKQLKTAILVASRLRNIAVQTYLECPRSDFVPHITYVTCPFEHKLQENLTTWID